MLWHKQPPLLSQILTQTCKPEALCLACLNCITRRIKKAKAASEDLLLQTLTTALSWGNRSLGPSGMTGHWLPCTEKGVREECWRLCSKGTYTDLLWAGPFFSHLAPLLQILEFIISRISSRVRQSRKTSGGGKEGEKTHSLGEFTWGYQIKALSPVSLAVLLYL